MIKLYLVLSQQYPVCSASGSEAKEIEETIKNICCNGIETGYEIKFIEIGLEI